MDKPLTTEDVDNSLRSKVYAQNYSSKPTIDGVKIFTLKNSVGEDGDFTELLRLSAEGTLAELPEFKIAQVNYSSMLPGTIKAWHLHFAQDEIWFTTPSGRLMLGLWDVREGSPTKGVTMKIPAGNTGLKLVYIPRGVAHGAAVLGADIATVIYFINNQFDIQNPDERRLPWNSLPDFWTPTHE